MTTNTAYPAVERPARWTDSDLGRAFREVLVAIPATGWAGPTFTRTPDGWECSATRIDGRRLRHTVRTIDRNPVDAMLALADAVRAAVDRGES